MIREPRHGPRNKSSVEETELGDEEEGLWKYLGNEGDGNPESFLPFKESKDCHFVKCIYCYFSLTSPPGNLFV